MRPRRAVPSSWTLLNTPWGRIPGSGVTIVFTPTPLATSGSPPRSRGRYICRAPIRRGRIRSQPHGRDPCERASLRRFAGSATTSCLGPGGTCGDDRPATAEAQSGRRSRRSRSEALTSQAPNRVSRDRQARLTSARPSAAPSPRARGGSSTTPGDRPRAYRIRRRSARAAWAPGCWTRRGASETTLEISGIRWPVLSYGTRGDRVTLSPANPPAGERHSLDPRIRQKVGTSRTATDSGPYASSGVLTSVLARAMRRRNLPGAPGDQRPFAGREDRTIPLPHDDGPMAGCSPPFQHTHPAGRCRRIANCGAGTDRFLNPTGRRR